jgi:hypothetical protein
VHELVKRVRQVERAAKELDLGSRRRNAACVKGVLRQVQLGQRAGGTEGNVRRRVVQPRGLAGVHHQPNLVSFLLDEEEPHPRADAPAVRDQAALSKLLDELDARVALRSQPAIPVRLERRHVSESALDFLVRPTDVAIEITESRHNLRRRKRAQRLGDELLLEDLKLLGVEGRHPARGSSIHIIRVEELQEGSARGKIGRLTAVPSTAPTYTIENSSLGRGRLRARGGWAAVQAEPSAHRMRGQGVESDGGLGHPVVERKSSHPPLGKVTRKHRPVFKTGAARDR